MGSVRLGFIPLLPTRRFSYDSQSFDIKYSRKLLLFSSILLSRSAFFVHFGLHFQVPLAFCSYQRLFAILAFKSFL